MEICKRKFTDGDKIEIFDKKSKNVKFGEIKVGTIYYDSKKNKIFPEADGFKLIEVMTPSTKYGSLGPYALRSSKGAIFENIWQFSKVYEKVPFVECKNYWESQKQRKSIYDWKYPSHIQFNSENYTLTDDYWKWRETGFMHNKAVRYPVGFDPKMRSSCLGALWNSELNLDQNAMKWDIVGKPKFISYIEARKQIYLKNYSDLVRKKTQFKELLNELQSGQNLLIAEVDGPKKQFLDYYLKTFEIEDQNWFKGNCVSIDEKTLKLFLNDTKSPFGHGFCLAAALLGLDQIIVKD